MTDGQAPAIARNIAALGRYRMMRRIRSFEERVGELRAREPHLDEPLVAAEIDARSTDPLFRSRSVRAGRRIQLSDVGLFADGTAVKLVGEETFRITRALVDDYVVVDTDEVCAAIKDVFQDTRSIMEPSGAMGVAGIKQYVARHPDLGPGALDRIRRVN